MHRGIFSEYTKKKRKITVVSSTDILTIKFWYIFPLFFLLFGRGEL